MMLVEVLVLRNDSRPVCEVLHVFNQGFTYLMPVCQRPLCIPIVAWLHPWEADRDEYQDGCDTYVYHPDFGWCRPGKTRDPEDILGEGLIDWYTENSPVNGLWRTEYTYEHEAWVEKANTLVIPLPTPDIED